MQAMVKMAIEDAKVALKEYFESDPDAEISDVIHEVADSHVPVYTGDLMQLAADDISLATNEPELGPAFDGSPTPVNIIAANVYDAIEAALWEYWNDELEEEVSARLEGVTE